MKISWVFIGPEANTFQRGVGILDSHLVQKKGQGADVDKLGQRIYLRSCEKPQKITFSLGVSICPLLLPSPKGWISVKNKQKTHNFLWPNGDSKMRTKYFSRKPGKKGTEGILSSPGKARWLNTKKSRSFKSRWPLGPLHLLEIHF